MRPKDIAQLKALDEAIRRSDGEIRVVAEHSKYWTDPSIGEAGAGCVKSADEDRALGQEVGQGAIQV